MRISPLLGLCLSLTSLNVPSIALSQTSPKAEFCQTVRRDRAYSQWQRISAWLNPDAPPTPPVPARLPGEIVDLLKRSQGNPKETVLAIDRLTNSSFGADFPSYSQGLLTLLDRTPATQRSGFLPVIAQLVTTANTLPTGYNSAQSRALIAAAHAYQKLGQSSDRVMPLLQRATQLSPGISTPLLRAHVQFRLAQAQAAWGQTQAEVATIDQAAASLRAISEKDKNFIGPLLEKLVDRLLVQNKREQAIAVANAADIKSEGFRQLVKVAIADQANQPQRATELFNSSLQRLHKATPPGGDWTFEGARGMVAFAQAGSLTPVATVAPQLPDTVAYLRAQVWLTIAGTARQRNQPQLAAQALNQFIAAGKVGKAQNFGMGFGDQRDYDWSLPLFRLAHEHGYAMEMTKFLNELDLRSQGAEFLIMEAMKAKQFDQAKQAVPIPMWRSIDAGSFEVQNRWLLRVATDAAAAGQPQQLNEISQKMLTELRQMDGLNLFIVNDVIQLLEELKKHNQTALVPDLLAELTQQSNLVLGLSSDRWGEAESIAQSLKKIGYNETATQIQQAVIQKFLGIQDSNDRFRQFQKIYAWPVPTLNELIPFSEAIKITQHPDYPGWLSDKLFMAQNIELMEQWLPRAAKTPVKQLHTFTNVGEILLHQNPQKALEWHDRALVAAKQIKFDPKKSEPVIQKLMNGYVYLGQFDKAKQAANVIVNPADRKAALDRLSCF